MLLAFGIVAVSLWYSNRLANKLANEERAKMEMMAITYQHISEAGDNTDLGFLLHMVNQNKTIPLILTDYQLTILDAKNYDSLSIAKDSNFLKRELNVLRLSHDSIPIVFNGKVLNYIFYKDSYLLTQLKYFPYVQLIIISLFLVVCYLAFFSSQRSIQNQLWVGMAKETAHQLATPISSMSACLEQLEAVSDSDPKLPAILTELHNDVGRLETITNRFGKIGSVPQLKAEDFEMVINRSVAYVKQRSSQRVQYLVNNHLPTGKTVLLNIALFDWVIENLIKNSLDAMAGDGKITVTLSESEKYVITDITDTGKGIASNLFKTIFKPGFSTKKRGWGLGLSLCKRIVEEYHNGKIFVKESIPGKATTFRILLRK